MIPSPLADPPRWGTSADRSRTRELWMGFHRHSRGLQAAVLQAWAREEPFLNEVVWVLGVINRGIEERYGLAPRRKSLE